MNCSGCYFTLESLHTRNSCVGDWPVVSNILFINRPRCIQIEPVSPFLLSRRGASRKDSVLD